MGAENLNHRNKVDHTHEAATLSIFGYTDYRKYLGDYYSFRKNGVRGYSYRNFSKAAGFSSPNFLKLVVEGQRNLGAEAVEKCIKALHLNRGMAEYFRILVRLNQSIDDQEKHTLINQLIRLTPQAKRRDLQGEALQYLSHWIYPVLREMIQMPDFHDDPYWIARRLHGKVSTQDISQAMKFLMTEGFIEKRDDGTYVAKENLVFSSDEVRSLAVRNYHRQMLEQANDALTTLSIQEREFGALTLVLPSEAMTELKERIKTFRRDLHLWAMQAAAHSAGDQVIQVNMQMYPHTKKVAS